MKPKFDKNLNNFKVLILYPEYNDMVKKNHLTLLSLYGGHLGDEADSDVESNGESHVNGAEDGEGARGLH
jgi:hypothetical protein